MVGYQEGGPHGPGHVLLPDAQVAFAGDRITFVGRGYTGPVDVRIGAAGQAGDPRA